MRRVVIALCAFALASCSGDVDDGVVDVAFIAPPEALDASGVRLESAGQHIRAATTQGLVRLDASGNVVPALAERWIVTDDGKSYIFRITEFDLANGERLTAQEVRDSLQRSRAALRGTSLGLDLDKIAEVRAMTARVIEVRLKSAMPGLLQLLAQPELGVELPGGTGSGPMTASKADRGALRLEALPPEARGLPKQPDWGDGLLPVKAYAASAASATDGFAKGRFDLVLGGTLATLPLANDGPLARGTIRLDSAVGLFGLDVRHQDGFLASAENREALAMAIDREGLLKPFNIGGWVATTRLVAPELAGDSGAVGERWQGLSLEARRAQATARVNRWRATTGRPPVVSLWLPDGPGSDIVFFAIARDFATVGVSVRRADSARTSDLALRDRVARYGSASWFLNQFDCTVSPRQCSAEADDFERLAVSAATPAEEAGFHAQAEIVLTRANLYIPLGAPIRWSLARANLVGFVENPWNLHPLFPLSRAPM